MQAGKLRQRLQIQHKTDVRDDIGGVEQQWTTLATVWAHVEPLRARELLQAQQVESRVTHRITLRWRAGVDQAMRLQEEGTARVFNPSSILNLDERDRTLELLAQEVNP